jgi:tRNA pseudouridine13 synthase
VSELEAQGGIPNFFGHQRFGTTRAITHLVGKAIVDDNFEKAALLFLAKPSPHEHAAARKARETLQSTHDFLAALKDFPRQLRYERLMLHHLIENPRDFAGAFESLPLKLQLLFVQAYQAYLFNLFLSERLRHEFSLNIAEVGDQVVSVDRLGLPMPKTGKLVTVESLAEVNSSVRAGKMRVAMPLVGFGQRVSAAKMGQIEAQILQKEGVKSTSFKVRELPRISSRGELRAIVSPIEDFRIVKISRDSRLPRMHQVKMSFTLRRGSYATLLLREVMKPRDPLVAGF